MAKAKKPASKKRSSSKAKSAAKSAAAKHEPVDTGVRQLVSKSVVASLAREQKMCLSRAGDASQAFSTEMKKAQERGLNPVSFRLATRLTRMAERDPAKALCAYEDLTYYLECLEFEKMTSKSLFAASEVRSGKRGSTKRKTDEDAEHEGQTEDTELAPGANGSAEAIEAAAVH